MRLRIEGGTPLRGSLQVPADKSVVHRALMLGALAEGESQWQAFAPGEDNRSTQSVMQALGAHIKAEQSENGVQFSIQGVGLDGLKAPKHDLDCGNSGTTMRLLSGILAGGGVEASLVGDASLSRRPMGRICKPLRGLGACIEGQEQAGKELPPLRVQRGNFQGGRYDSPIASAQVKSAVLLAGLCAGKAVTVTEPSVSRDHTERMLQAMGVSLEQTEVGGRHAVLLHPGQLLSPLVSQAPGDISAAAFWLAAGLTVQGSSIELHHVGLNSTRTGILEILEQYGAQVNVIPGEPAGGEPVGALQVRHGALSPASSVRVGGAVIPKLIDELVVLGAIAASVNVETLVQDAAELRVKESDRVEATVGLLQAFGVDAQGREDGYHVRGGKALQPARVDVGMDHRIAMTAAVLALAAPGESVLDGFDIAAVSYPGFVHALESLGARVRVDEV